MNQRILFQAYGDEGIIAECKFALLRLLAIYAAESSVPEIVVYTDKPEDFAAFRKLHSLHLVPITAQQIQAWKGRYGFVHRVKIGIIQDCLLRFGGKLLYTDTDTCCLQKTEELFTAITTTQVVMYEKEGALSQPRNLHFKKWSRFLKKNSFAVSSYQPAVHTVMWNAGVVGIQQAHLPLLQKVMEITDRLYPLFPKHTVEQFAFCYVFQNEGLQAVPAQAYFFHYWNLKELRRLLLHFFHQNEKLPFDQLVRASQAVNPAVIVRSKLSFEEKPALVKKIKKWMGRSWKIDPFMPENQDVLTLPYL